MQIVKFPFKLFILMTEEEKISIKIGTVTNEEPQSQEVIENRQNQSFFTR